MLDAVVSCLEALSAVVDGNHDNLRRFREQCVMAFERRNETSTDDVGMRVRRVPLAELAPFLQHAATRSVVLRVFHHLVKEADPSGRSVSLSCSSSLWDCA
jgi:hypothetical protein